MKAKPRWDRKAYMRAYYQKPEVKERKRIYTRDYKKKKRTIPDAMLSPRVKRLLALFEGET